MFISMIMFTENIHIK